MSNDNKQPSHQWRGAGVRLVPSEWAEDLLWYSCHVLHAEAKKKTQHEKPLGKVA